MGGAVLYSIYSDLMRNQGLLTTPWDVLDSREREAWNGMGRAVRSALKQAKKK